MSKPHIFKIIQKEIPSLLNRELLPIYKSNGRVLPKTNAFLIQHQKYENNYFHFIIILITLNDFFLITLPIFVQLVLLYQGRCLLKSKIYHVNLIYKFCSIHCYKTIYCCTV